MDSVGNEVDAARVSLLSSSDDICDINFVSHDLVLVVLNKGQLLQYQKSGRIVWKTEIPILHVSRVRSQGCATAFVMTNYGTIYSLCLPYDYNTSPIRNQTSSHWFVENYLKSSPRNLNLLYNDF